MDKICKTCNNYDRDTGECQGEPSDYVNGSSDNVIWFKPPPNFTCTYWTPRPCLKEYGKCDCVKCKADKESLSDADRDSYLRRC